LKVWRPGLRTLPPQGPASGLPTFPSRGVAFSRPGLRPIEDRPFASPYAVVHSGRKCYARHSCGKQRTSPRMVKFGCYEALGNAAPPTAFSLFQGGTVRFDDRLSKNSAGARTSSPQTSMARRARRARCPRSFCYANFFRVLGQSRGRYKLQRSYLTFFFSFVSPGESKYIESSPARGERV